MSFCTKNQTCWSHLTVKAMFRRVTRLKQNQPYSHQKQEMYQIKTRTEEGHISWTKYLNTLSGQKTQSTRSNFQAHALCQHSPWVMACGVSTLVCECRLCFLCQLSCILFPNTLHASRVLRLRCGSILNQVQST